MNILFNALGICTSGGVTVLDKSLRECSLSVENEYIIVCSDNVNIAELMERHKNVKNFRFHLVLKTGVFYRVYYENFVFFKIVRRHKIELIYNFSGTSQRFLKVNKLVKVHNLIFYSKRLDWIYARNHQTVLWLREILLKRFFLQFMLGDRVSLELQSRHVQSCLSDFINTANKKIYIKSDVDVSEKEFSQPRHYNFTKKVKFLYIVGPHFNSVHKNFNEFVGVMSMLNDCKVDFEINITLFRDQLVSFSGWSASLNSKTNFLGYISDQEKMAKLFCDNTILISTSVVETLGLHVIEGIKNGVITIAPDEEYANTVYGESMFKYELFNKNSLFNIIMTVINSKESCSDKILSIQDDLRKNEMSKFGSILDVFNEVKNVQK